MQTLDEMLSRRLLTQGRLPVEDDRGVVREGKEALHDLAEQWRHGGSRIEEASPRREAFNIMLSMPAGTDPLIVQRAAREFAQHELADHRWVMVLHDHQANPHAHLSVRAESRHGKRLNPRKANLHGGERLSPTSCVAMASRPRPRGRPLAASSADLNRSGRSTHERTGACRHPGRKRSGAPARTQAAKTPPRHGSTSPPRWRSQSLSTTGKLARAIVGHVLRMPLVAERLSKRELASRQQRDLPGMEQQRSGASQTRRGPEIGR